MKARTCCYWYSPELGYCINPNVPSYHCDEKDYCEKCPEHLDLRKPENFQLLKEVSPNCLQVTLWKRWFQSERCARREVKG